jgi:hypothetical protein
MLCPHCGSAVFKSSGDARLKARVTVLVLRKGTGGEVQVETNCDSCKGAILLPLVLAAGPFEIRKSDQPRLVVRRT